MATKNQRLLVKLNLTTTQAASHISTGTYKGFLIKPSLATVVVTGAYTAAANGNPTYITFDVPATATNEIGAYSLIMFKNKDTDAATISTTDTVLKQTVFNVVDTDTITISM